MIFPLRDMSWVWGMGREDCVVTFGIYYILVSIFCEKSSSLIQKGWGGEGRGKGRGVGWRTGGRDEGRGGTEKAGEDVGGGGGGNSGEIHSVIIYGSRGNGINQAWKDFHVERKGFHQIKQKSPLWNRNHQQLSVLFFMEFFFTFKIFLKHETEFFYSKTIRVAEMGKKSIESCKSL